MLRAHIAEDVRDVIRYFWKTVFGEYICMNAEAGHIQGQFPDNANPVLQGRGCLIRVFLGPCVDKFFGQEPIASGETELVEFREQP